MAIITWLFLTSTGFIKADTIEEYSALPRPQKWILRRSREFFCVTFAFVFTEIILQLTVTLRSYLGTKQDIVLTLTFEGILVLLLLIELYVSDNRVDENDIGVTVAVYIVWIVVYFQYNNTNRSYYESPNNPYFWTKTDVDFQGQKTQAILLGLAISLMVFHSILEFFCQKKTSGNGQFSAEKTITANTRKDK